LRVLIEHDLRDPRELLRPDSLGGNPSFWWEDNDSRSLLLAFESPVRLPSLAKQLPMSN